MANRKFDNKVITILIIFGIVLMISAIFAKSTFFKSQFMTKPTPTTTPTTPDDIYIPNQNADTAKKIEELAREDLAAKLSIQKSQINLVSTEPKQWSDTSLGCPQPGKMYAQVIMPGYLVILEAGDKEYNYHTTLEIVTLCSPQGK